MTDHKPTSKPTEDGNSAKSSVSPAKKEEASNNKPAPREQHSSAKASDQFIADANHRDDAARKERIVPVDQPKTNREARGLTAEEDSTPRFANDTTMVGHEAPVSPDDQIDQWIKANQRTAENGPPIKQDDLAPNEGDHKETPAELQVTRHYAGPPTAA